MVSKELTIETTSGTLAHAHVPARCRGSESCDRHGPMDRLDPDDLEIERNGVVWEVDPDTAFADGDGAEIHYCPECIDEDLRAYDRPEASDLELLREAIADEWNNSLRPGTMDGSLFSVAEVTQNATLEFCPYCSSDLESVDETAVRCPIHGRLSVDVEPLGEVPPLEAE